MSVVQEAAERAVTLAKKLGASEVKAWGSRASEIGLKQREGRIEETSEASTQGLTLSLLVDDRYSSHSTSDLRPEALEAFLELAVAATRYLEQDPDRRMADRADMGAADEAALDLCDAGFGQRGPEGRRAAVAALEQAVLARDPGDLVSATAHLWEVKSEAWAVFSNGFSAHKASTSFGWGSEATISEPGGKLPEAYSFWSARHLDDVPTTGAVAEDLWQRIDETRRCGPVESLVCPMVLDRRAVGRLLGPVLGALGGAALWEGRSFLRDRIGDKLVPEGLEIWDDPTIPRGLGSRAFDGDGLLSKRRPVLLDGAFQAPFLNVYYARKLKQAPTSGGASNLVVPAGDTSWQDLVADAPRAMRVTSFLGGNANSTSGDFSFGIRGQLLEHGKPIANVAEMNVAGNLLDLLSRFVAAGDDTWTWSAWRAPSLVFADVQFSGTS